MLHKSSWNKACRPCVDNTINYNVSNGLLQYKLKWCEVFLLNHRIYKENYLQFNFLKMALTFHHYLLTVQHVHNRRESNHSQVLGCHSCCVAFSAQSVLGSVLIMSVLHKDELCDLISNQCFRYKFHNLWNIIFLINARCVQHNLQQLEKALRSM